MAAATLLSPSGTRSPRRRPSRLRDVDMDTDTNTEGRGMSDSDAKSSTVSTGNRVAQFIVVTAIFCVLYQLATSSEQSLEGAMESSSTPGTPSPSPFDDSPSTETEAAAAAGYRKEDSRRLSSSECTCFLACLGLFGLLQRSKQKKSDAKKLAGNDEELADAEFAALQRALLLSRKDVRRLKNKSTKATDALVAATTSNNSGVAMADLPRDVLNHLLLFLSARELTVCPMVCRSWNFRTGDLAEPLWRLVFERDFGERGDRFAQIFPIECWRQYYFQHHLSRAVELARLLGTTEGRKCVAIAGKVYDVTGFLDMHPGGPHVIGDAVGTDATVIWDQFRHSREARESMEQYLVPDPVLSRPSDRKLRGNLAQVASRWHKISWCLAHSHCFGRMAPQFTSVMFRFHSRAVAKHKAKALAAAQAMA